MSKQTVQVVTLWSSHEQAGSCYSVPSIVAMGIGFSKESALKELAKQEFASRIIDGAYNNVGEIPTWDPRNIQCDEDEAWMETSSELRVSWETREVD
jgi:hypothetical protein